MSTDQEKSVLETKGIATVYCNQALFSVSYNDVRAYVLEVSPSELLLNPTSAEFTQKLPSVEPKFCLVLSPEFARSFANAILASVGQYEKVFGQLRPEPTQEQINQAVAKK